MEISSKISIKRIFFEIGPFRGPGFMVYVWSCKTASQQNLRRITQLFSLSLSRGMENFGQNDPISK
jgi:hypothetical protein